MKFPCATRQKVAGDQRAGGPGESLGHRGDAIKGLSEKILVSPRVLSVTLTARHTWRVPLSAGV